MLRGASYVYAGVGVVAAGEVWYGLCTGSPAVAVDTPVAAFGDRGINVVQPVVRSMAVMRRRKMGSGSFMYGVLGLGTG
jgi:hypothetical protein